MLKVWGVHVAVFLRFDSRTELTIGFAMPKVYLISIDPKYDV
jgi:hypothetical protein